MMNYQMAKKQKTNKPAYQRPITVLLLLQFLLLVKFSLFCVVVFFFLAEWWGVVNRWAIGITLFSLHLLFNSLHFELSRVSLSVSLQSPSMSEGLLISCSWFQVLLVWQASPEGYLFQASGVLRVNSVKGFTKSYQKTSFLTDLFSRSRYMKRVQLFNGRYTKGVPFVKNSIYKGKGLDLGAKPLRTKLYWVASHPPPSPFLPRAFHNLAFLATCSISSNFFRFKQLFA